MTITVKFQDEVQQIKKPSDMPALKPFVVKHKGSNVKEVAFFAPNGTVILFRHDGSVSWDDSNQFEWFDAKYVALPNEKATVILEV